MPAVKCRCGAETNSAVSEYWNSKSMESGIANGCYVKWVEDHWEKGCLYDQTTITDFMRKMADTMIQEKEG